MTKSKKRNTRRHRRSGRARVKHGRKAAPRHRLQSGRTGGVHFKRRKAARKKEGGSHAGNQDG